MVFAGFGLNTGPENSGSMLYASIKKYHDEISQQVSLMGRQPVSLSTWDMTNFYFYFILYIYIAISEVFKLFKDLAVRAACFPEGVPTPLSWIPWWKPSPCCVISGYSLFMMRLPDSRNPKLFGLEEGH
jgi:hypothetical protein